MPAIAWLARQCTAHWTLAAVATSGRAPSAKMPSSAPAARRERRRRTTLRAAGAPLLIMARTVVGSGVFRASTTHLAPALASRRRCPLAPHRAPSRYYVHAAPGAPLHRRRDPRVPGRRQPLRDCSRRAAGDPGARWTASGTAPTAMRHPAAVSVGEWPGRAAARDIPRHCIDVWTPDATAAESVQHEIAWRHPRIEAPCSIDLEALFRGLRGEASQFPQRPVPRTAPPPPVTPSASCTTPSTNSRSGSPRSHWRSRCPPARRPTVSRTRSPPPGCRSFRWT